MQGKERVSNILKRTTKDIGFWLGNPSEKAKNIYFGYFGIQNSELTRNDKKETQNSTLKTGTIGLADIQLASKLGSDLMWLSPEFDQGFYKHPHQKPIWDVLNGKIRESLGEEGIFAETEDVAEVERFDWPDPEYIDFSETILNIQTADHFGLDIFGGMWCPFFHVVSDFFGMENYFVKMHTDPAVVLAVTEHVVDFYLEANKKCFNLMSDTLSCAFIGNDLGSQLGCLISSSFFDKFIAPYARKLIDQMKSYGLKVAFHSCGAIFDLIPKLIDLGVDVLHPLQAKAAQMDAKKLKDTYGDDLVFMGGVDTQELLPFGTPVQVKDEVRRLKDIFKQNYIVSPSHEALLENVSVENVIAMSEAANE